MKLLHIIHSTDPAGGGPIEGLKQVSRVMDQMGHSTVVATLDSPDAPWLNKLPFDVYALGPGKGRYGYSRHLAPWLKQNAQRFDAVIVRGLWQYHGYAARKVLRKSGIPYFVFTHGMLDPWFKKTYPLKHAKKWLYWPWVDYRVLRDAAGVLFTSEEEKILARQSFWLYRCKEIVVNYGTAALTGDVVLQKSVFFDRYPQLGGKRIALFLGRIHPKKGCDLLIQSFAQVLAKDPQWRLVIAGPDQVNWKEKLQVMAQKLGIASLITWPGMISGDLKYGAIQGAEMFVLPSHQENFGIAVVEAMACGKPALISNKVNIWREIEQDDAGIVAADDLAGTCSVLNRWQSMSREDQRSMGERAQSCFEKRFEIRKSAESLIRVLSDAGASSGQSVYESSKLMPVS